MIAFDYHKAFSRNIGWFTHAEQDILRNRRVAIAGLGGVGGVHLLTMARLGIGHFRLADFDSFGIENFNRQAGAAMSTLDQPKLDVLCAMARDINPELSIELFPAGVSNDNLDAFLNGADIYIDGLDFFAFPARRATFAACARLNVPAVTAAPMGMSAAMLTFMPGEMSFEDYFRFEGLDETRMAIQFMIGLSPKALHRHYLVDRTAVNLPEQRGPSTIIACQLCAGMAAAEAIKILLKRGEVTPAPWSTQYDAYQQKLTRTYRKNGNAHFRQKLLFKILNRQFSSPQA